MSTLPASAEIVRTRADRAASRSLMLAMLPAATALSLLGVAVLALFTPIWVHLALSMSGADAWLGSTAMARELSDRTIAELLVGPANFAFAGPDGTRFYTADEAAHLRDVRLVLFGFLAAASAAVALIVGSLARGEDTAAAWRGIARGGVALALVLAVGGAIAALAFGPAFELFHRVLFPGGNWAFPADSNLIRLYPLGFWQLSSAALGAVGIAGGVLTWLVARRRARAMGSQAVR